jgi:Golgi phosphoprotein 3
VDELLAEYSQWPFGKRTGGASGVGANLGQVVAEEVSTGKDKELQLEVSLNNIARFSEQKLTIS